MPGLISTLRQARQKSVPWVAAGKCGTLQTYYNFFPFQGESKSWGFYPVILHWANRREYGKWMNVTNRCLCFHWPPIWCPFLSAFRFRQDRNQSFEQYPLKVRILVVWSRFFFFSPRRSWELRVSSQLCFAMLWGGSVMSGCHKFLPAFMQPVKHLPGVQHSFNWFLDFSQRTLVYVLLLSHCL